MKTLAAFCLLVGFSTFVMAQVATTDPAAKPKPLEPIIPSQHAGPGRIGVTLEFPKDGLPQIASMTRGGPVADAGFKVGDVIIKIDKNYTNTLTEDEVKLALHGDPRTGVELTVQRSDDPKWIIRAVERRILPDNADNVNPGPALPSSPTISVNPPPKP